MYRLADKKKCSVHLADTKKVLSSGFLTKRRCSVQASRYKKGAQCRLKESAQCRLADLKRVLSAG
jgi:hypothetical protein